MSGNTKKSNSGLKQAGVVIVGGALAYAFLPFWVTAGAVGVYAYTKKDKIKEFFN